MTALRTKDKRRGQRLCIDFDGVIHDYTDGFRHGEIYGQPIPGAFETMQRLYDAGYDICVLTTRGRDPELRMAVVAWMTMRQVEMELDFEFEVTGEKLPAIAYIDDRAVRFTNWADIRKYWD